jgi:hypothetical protein
LVLGKEKSSSRRQVTVTDPLPSVFFGTRQRGQFYRVPAIMALGKDGSSGPHRQSLCLMDWLSAKSPLVGPFASPFVECAGRHSAKVASLPSVLTTALGKEGFIGSQVSFFAECHGHNTRQSDQKVPFLFVFAVPSKQTKDIYHSHHIIYHSHHRINTFIINTIYITNITT